MGGVTAWMLRALCEPAFEGGRGYTLDEVGQMSLDQICALLCSTDTIKRAAGRMSALEAAAAVRPGPDGLRAGRDAEGKPIRAKIVGKSKARQLMEAEEARKRQEQEAATKEGRKGRRRRRGS